MCKAVQQIARNTLELPGGAFLLAVAVSISPGIYTAVQRGRPVSTINGAVAVFAYAIPNSILVIFLIFRVTLHGVPRSGKMTGVHLMMPIVTLVMTMTVWNICLSWSAMLGVLNEDFIRIARAKVLCETLVVNNLALPTAMIRIVSNAGLQVAGFVG